MNKAELSGVCRQMRRDIINMTANAGSGHPGGSLSAVELVASVFYNHMRIDPKIRTGRTVTVLCSARATLPPVITRFWRSWAL